MTAASIVSGLEVVYNSRDTTGQFLYTPVADAFGLVRVTLSTLDAGVDGIFGNLDDRSVDRTFAITVLPVNDAPTINQVPNITLTEDGPTHTVNLSGITPGPGELEAVRISASIDDTSVLVIPSGGSAVGKKISIGGEDFTYVTTSTGDDREIVIIDVVTLVIVDSTFEVAQATADTLNAFFGAGSAIATGNTVSTALTIGVLEAPFIAITASEIISQPVVDYTTGSTAGTLSFTPRADNFGGATITLTVEDAGIDGIFGTTDDATTIREVSIYVQPVNDLPSFSPLADMLLPVSAGVQTVDLTSILNGPLNELETLRVTVTSSDTNFLPTPIVQYISPQNSGTLTFTPAAGLSGAATITVTLEDAGVDGVFEDSVTPQLEQADNLRIVRTFRVTTPPIILSPSGTITDSTPLLSWTAIPGTSAYRVELINITDGVTIALGTNLVGTNSLQVSTPLPLAAYQLRVQAIDGFSVPGLWSETADFTVATAPAILAPVSNRVPDSTPTFSWQAVLGAESYSLEVIDDLTNVVVFPRTTLTGTSVTLQDPLPLGRYRYTITAINPPSGTSTAATVTAVASGIVTISTPPEITAPFVAIYDTTPTIQWDSVTGAVSHELELFNVTTNTVEFTVSGITELEYTVPNAEQLDVGEYRARVRAFGDVAETVASDFSTVHVFLVGTAPVLIGPSGGIGAAPFRKTVNDQPTFRWEGALDGETYRVWWNSVTEGRRIYLEDGVEETSFTPPDKLPVGEYRVWVQAQTGTGEPSAWSSSYDFEIVTPPVINSFGTSTFNNQPTITWNAQERVDRWQVWVNEVGNNNPVVLYNLTDPADQVTTNSFQFPDTVPDGRYRVWVGGFATNEATGKVTTTQWSSVYQFDIGGRPSLNVPVSTTDTTPSINWSVVEGAASYEVYLAAAEAIGTPIVRETGVSGNSFTFNQLPIGDYRVWVRARAIDGRTTPWSLSSQTFMSVSLTQALVAPVLGNVTLNGRTPTFTWGAVASAARYEIYVAPLTTTGTPTVRVDNITSTTYTANAGIPVDNYRVWVRAISLTGALGPWSAPTSFAVASTDVQGVSGQPETMLTRISMTDVAALVQEQVTVSQTPVTVVDRSEGPADPQTIFVVRQAKTVAQVSDSVALTSADDLMANWDDAIWAEESAAVLVADSVQSAGTKEEASAASWMSGLAAITPALFRRRRSRKD